jgi:hypothetical protein
MGDRSVCNGSAADKLLPAVIVYIDKGTIETPEKLRFA